MIKFFNRFNIFAKYNEDQNGSGSFIDLAWDDSFITLLGY